MVFVGKKFIFFPDPYPIVPCQVKPDQIKSKPQHQFERTTYMFIGRKTELDFLNKHHATESGQLIVLYGRRRVGKTETLLEFCKGKEHIYFASSEQSDEMQLKAFSQAILQKGHPASRYIQSFANWTEAFASLQDLPWTGRKLLIIDEFPYMVKCNPTIPSLLQNLWDAKLRHQNLTIILCGSYISFMENEILDRDKPLYGRTTAILKMLPLDFYEAVQFFPNYSAEDKIKAYGVLGGIPHYLKQFDSSLSLEENITQQILTRGSILYSEVEFLLHHELRETSNYNTIIQSIAQGNSHMNDLHTSTQIEKTKLSSYLSNLMDLGIVWREFPTEAPVINQAKGHRGIYRLSDPFFRFWFRYVFPYLSELEAGDASSICSYVVKPDLDAFTYRPYTLVCHQYLRELNHRNRLPFHFIKIGRWWNKKERLSVMATDAAKKNFLTGDCWFDDNVMTLKDALAIKARVMPEAGVKPYYWLFSKAGFTDELKAAADKEKLNLVGLEDLLKLE